MTDIDKLAREIAARVQGTGLLQEAADQIRAGEHDDWEEVKAARLALIEGERRGLEMAAEIVASLDSERGNEKVIAHLIREAKP